MSNACAKCALVALVTLALVALGCGSAAAPTSLSSLPAPTDTPTPSIPTPIPGRYGIFIMRLDTTDPRQIYSTDLRPGGLRPSADGSRFLFQFHYRDVDGEDNTAWPT